MKSFEYDIVNIDYCEQDAILLVDGERFYFQFEEEPTILAALQFFKKDSKFYEL